MRYSFLCHRHRSWLLQHPELARSIWFNNFEQACRMVEEDDFQGATAYAGCAMEAAAIAMDVEARPTPELIEQYTHTSALLARLLERVGGASPHDCSHQASHALH